MNDVGDVIIEIWLVPFAREIGNPIIMLLGAGTFVLFLWGVFKFVMYAGDSEKRQEGRAAMVYGVIGLVLVFGVYGLVNVLTATFNLEKVEPIGGQFPTNTSTGGLGQGGLPSQTPASGSGVGAQGSGVGTQSGGGSGASGVGGASVSSPPGAGGGVVIVAPPSGSGGGTAGGGGGAQTPPAPLLETYPVQPSTTDSAISDSFGYHYVYLKDPSRNQLFVFLPGTFAEPESLQLIGETAANAGFYSVGLAYPNDVTVGGVCSGSPDPDCNEKVRLEIIDGTDRTTVVSVSPADSIQNRLIRLLTYLDATYPTENWDQFIVNGTLQWANIVIGGHSQGGGHAALIAKNKSVLRAVLLAAPKEVNEPWLSQTSVTPTSRYYGFVHTKDQGGSYPNLATADAWAKLGMTGLSSVDGSAPPYQNAHMLTSTTACTLTGRPWLYYHSCVVNDNVTPLDASGNPLFEDVWLYLMGAL